MGRTFVILLLATFCATSNSESSPEPTPDVSEPNVASMQHHSTFTTTQASKTVAVTSTSHMTAVLANNPLTKELMSNTTNIPKTDTSQPNSPNVQHYSTFTTTGTSKKLAVTSTSSKTTVSVNNPSTSVLVSTTSNTSMTDSSEPNAPNVQHHSTFTTTGTSKKLAVTSPSPKITVSANNLSTTVSVSNTPNTSMTGRSFNQSCNRSQKCKDGLWCKGNQCLCSDTQFWQENSLICIERKTYSQGCNRSQECIEELWCRQNQCLCNETQFWQENPPICKERRSFSHSCNRSQECKEGLWCKQNLCLCNDMQFWQESSLTCIERPTDPDCSGVWIPQVDKTTMTFNLSTIHIEDDEYLDLQYQNLGEIVNVNFSSGNGFISTISDLTPGTLYNFSVFSVRIIKSLGNCTVQQYTYPSEPVNPVQNISNTSSIEISWTHPEGRVESFGVNVTCACEKKGCSPDIARIVQTSALIRGLYPGTHCRFVITAISGGLTSNPFMIPDVQNEEKNAGRVSDFTQIVTEETTTLMWNPPSEPNGDLKQYAVSISSATANFNKTTYVNDSVLYFTYTHLSPGVCYSVSVSAINSAGKGDISHDEIYTKETVPDAVEKIESKNVSSRSIELSWNKPSKSNGVITMYEICVKKAEQFMIRIQLKCADCERSCINATIQMNLDLSQENSQDSNEWCSTSNNRTFAINSTDVITYNVTGLEHFTKYSFDIRAHTAIGPGPTTNTSNMTSEDKPSVVTKLNTTEIETTSITLVFNTPLHRNGRIISVVAEYESQSHAICISNRTKHTVIQNKSEAIRGTLNETYSTQITDLHQYWTYRIRVRMATDAGYGNWSAFLPVTTAPSAPDPVSEIQITGNTSRSISLQWKEPCFPNGIIEFYHIYIIDGETLDFINQTRTRQNETTFTVMSLLPYRRYMFNISAKVKSVAQTGQNVSSPLTNTSTEEPSVVTKLNTTEIETTSITLVFNTPLHRNGRIISMVAEYESQSHAVCFSNRTKHTVIQNKSEAIRGTLNETYSTQITDLHQYWTYRIRVKMATDAGYGNWSAFLPVTTAPSAPDPVSEIQITGNTSRSISLQWKEPCFPNGIIEFYLIYIIDGETLDVINQTRTRQNETTFTAMSLLPYQRYMFNISAKVKSVAQTGQNVSSPLTITSTEEPSVVTKLNTTEIETTSITLVFNTPLHRNGRIISMVVEYESQSHAVCFSNRTIHTVIQNKSEAIRGTLNETYSTQITDLHQYWTYRIRVKMATDAGYGNWSAFLPVTTAPSAPDPVSEIQITGNTSRSISLQWKEPCFPNGIIEFYHIYIIDGETLDFINQTRTRQNETTFTVMSLLPYRRYMFNISAKVKSVAQTGQNASSPLTITSTEEPSVVTKLNTTEIETTSITLVFNTPLHRNGRIISMVAEYQSQSHAVCFSNRTIHTVIQNKSEAIRGTLNETYSTQITDLHQYWTYRIRVKMATDAGYGNWSAFLPVTTAPSAPDPVSEIQITGNTSRSIFLQWKEPCFPNGIIEFYHIYIIDGETLDFINQTRTRQNETTFTVMSLLPYRRYMFNISAKVKSVAQTGQNVSSPLTITSTEEPSVVTKLNTTEIETTSITLVFNTPLHRNGRIISMVAEYQSQSHAVCFSNRTIHTVIQNKSEAIRGTLNETYSTQITDLHQYWTYRIRVKMATDAGYGNWSAFLPVTTAPSAPDPVSEIQITGNTSRSLSLQWKEPCFPNGIIEFYYIYIIDGETLEFINQTRTRQNETTFTVMSLLPYRRYMFNISAKVKSVAQTGQNVSSPLTNTSTEAPFKPGKPKSTSITESSLNITWTRSSLLTGPTSYNVDAVDCENETSKFKCSTEGFMNTSCILNGLDSFWKYSVTVSAVTGKFPKTTSDTLLVTTGQSAPGRVRNFSVVPEKDIIKRRTVYIDWKQPARRDWNGIIKHYYIEYWPNKFKYSKKTKKYSNETLSSNISVKPERDYTFQIFAETVSNATVENYQSRTVKIKAGAPLPVSLPPSVLQINQGPLSKVSDDEKQVSVSFNPQSLCNDQNGRPVKWYIIVSGASAITTLKNFHSSLVNYETYIQSMYKTWFSVHDSDVFAPYIATDTWQPDCTKYFAQQTRGLMRRSTTAPINFVVGSEEDCETQKRYCNGYLKPKSSYKVKFTVCTKTGCLESKYSAAFTTEPNHVPAIVGSFFGVIAALAVVAFIAVVFLRWRSIGPFKGRTASFELENQNEDLATEMDSRKISKPRPVKITEFAEHVVKFHADSNMKFSSEYQMLKENSPSHSTKSAEEQGSSIKNRYINILAYDHSRVKLQSLQDEESSDYINASYIPGFNSQREYIAAQGPLTFTKDDFWRMIWEQNVTMIVMLTQLVERGKKKCDLYWPETCKEPVYFGDVVVEMDSESVLPDYVLRVMSVKLGDGKKSIKHFQFIAWPDMGIPETSEGMLNFVNDVRHHLSPLNTGPLVVHCSAGVGRTGTFIAVDHLMHQVKNSDVIDIYSLVLGLRNNRPNMVQTEDQYIFIHDCIKDFITKQNEDSDEEEEELQPSNECKVSIEDKQNEDSEEEEEDSDEDEEDSDEEEEDSDEEEEELQSSNKSPV